MFFWLDPKEPPHKSTAGQAPNQDCKSLSKYFIRETERIKLVLRISKSFSVGILRTEIFSFRFAQSYFLRQVFEVSKKYAVIFLRSRKDEKILSYQEY